MRSRCISHRWVFLLIICNGIKITLNRACQEGKYWPVSFQQIQLIQSSDHSYSSDFTMTAALAAELLSNAYQWSSFFPCSGDPQRCWIGRPGCCQHHLCHLSCSAASCSSCDKTWVYSGAENTGLNLAVRRSPSLSVSWQNWSSYPSLSVNQPRPKLDELVL